MTRKELIIFLFTNKKNILKKMKIKNICKLCKSYAKFEYSINILNILIKK